MAIGEPADRTDFVRELTESQPRLYSYILTLLPNSDVASDVLQNTNLVLWGKADQFTPGTNFYAWAMTTAHFQVLAYRKRISYEKLIFDDALIGELSQESANINEDASRGFQALRACLQKLSSQQRDLLRQRYEGGGSVARIAIEMNKTEGAVSQALFRIRKRLADCINGRIARTDGR